MTPEQIVAEASQWPPAQLADLVDRLTLTLHQAVDPEIDQAWKNETRRRLAEIESGIVQTIPGEEVTAQVRRIVGR